MIESIKQIVEKHLTGQFRPVPDGEERPMRCVVCEDTGFERYTDDCGRFWARPCGCRASIPVVMVNCPEEFRAIRLSAVERITENVQALQQLERWPPRGRDLYLHGRPGRGKTMLACALATEVGKSAQFEVVDTLLRDMVHDEEGERWKGLRDVPVLVLDDIGTAHTDWAVRALTTLYSERLARQKRTIFTSNKSLRELVETWKDERLGSRVAGAADIIELLGPDFRRRHGNHPPAR